MASCVYSTDQVIIHSLFVKYDRDGSGEIDAAELDSLLKDLGVQLKDENQRKGLLMLIDRDGSGNVSFDEFFKWWSKMASVQSFTIMEKNLEMISYVAYLFRKAGCTANGSLPLDKFASVYQQLYDLYHQSWPQVYKTNMFTTEQAIQYLDRDGDKNIIFYELMNWLNWV